MRKRIPTILRRRRSDSSAMMWRAALLVLLAAWPEATIGAIPPEVERAVAEAEAGYLDLAIGRLERLAAAPPVGREVLATLGRLYARAGRVEESLEILAPLAQDPQADLPLLLDTGRVAVAAERPDLARAVLSRAAGEDGGDQAMRLLGLLELREGEVREGYRWLRRYLLHHPDDVAIRIPAAAAALRLVRAGEAEELLTGIPPQTPQLRLLWGEIRLEQRRMGEAIELLQPLLADADPNIHLQARALTASALLAENRAAEVVELLEGHTERDVSLALLLAEAASRAEALEKAIAALAPHAGSGPVEVDQQMGRLLTLSGRFDEAATVLDRAVTRSPDHSASWQFLARARFALGETDAARVAAERARELQASTMGEADAEVVRQGLGRDPVGVRLGEAQDMHREGRPEAALELVRKEAQLAPGDPRLPLVEAAMLLRLGRFREARTAADRALALDSSRADGWFLRGQAAAELGEPGAKADLERALEIAPGHPGATNQLASLLAARGEVARARRLLAGLLRDDPDNEVARENLRRLGGPLE